MKNQLIAEDVPNNALVRDYDGTYYFRYGIWGYLVKGAGVSYQIILNFDPVTNTRRSRSKEKSQCVSNPESVDWFPKPFSWFKRGFFQLVAIVKNSLSSEQVGELINNFEKEHSKLEFSNDLIIDVECCDVLKLE